jgi:DNA-binding IclR family transcriptional regulator
MDMIFIASLRMYMIMYKSRWTQVGAARRNGYAVTHDGVYLGASEVAAPIATGSDVTSSVAVIVPKQRFDDAREAAIVGHVKAAAESLH